MSTLTLSQFGELVKSITDFLKNDQDRFRKFTILLNRFKRSPSNPELTLFQIKSLLSDNPALCEMIDSACKEFPSDENLLVHLVNFIHETNNISPEPRLGFILAEVLSYYSEELINISFLHYYISLIISDLSIDIQKEIQAKIHYLAQEVDIHRIKLLQSNKLPSQLVNSLPIDYDMEPYFSIPHQIQFLVMINLLISSPENLSCIIKCLKLYGNQIINDEEAITWIGQFNSFISDFFMKLITETEPSTFLPLSLNDLIQKHIPSEQLRVWALGETLLSLISEASEDESLNNTKIIDEKNSFETHSKNNLFLPQSFLSLRTETFFNELEKTAKSIQNQQEIKISKKIINSIYGKNQSYLLNGTTSDSVNTILKRIKQLGGNFVAKEVQVFLETMEVLDQGCNEWRINYTSLLKPEFLKKALVFQGFEFNINEQEKNKSYNTINSEITNLLKTILTKFCSKFSKINNTFMNDFIKCFDDGISYCNMDIALCLYYFFSMYKSIQISLETKNISLNDEDEFITQLNSLADLVFDTQVPLHQFEGTSLSQIDVPLMLFAKRAARNKEKVVVTNDISIVLSDHTETHFFEINNKSGVFKLIPGMNSTCLPDFIIPIKGNLGKNTKTKEEKQPEQKNNSKDNDIQEEENLEEDENNDDEKDEEFKEIETNFENRRRRRRKSQANENEANTEN